MAEKNNYYGSGIFVAGNIDIGAIGKPADSRVMVPNPSGLDELVADKRVYDGMIVYCESTKTYHKCSVEWDSSMNITSSSWKQVEIQSLDELKALIAQESTAAMEFKGVISNGQLPTLSEGVNYDGDLYKITTKNVTIPVALNAEGGEVDVVAKPGDSIVCEGGKWYLIPSGDDVDDTWRAIKVNGVEKLGIGTTTGAVDFVQGDNVTISEAGGVITIAAADTHYESKLVAANSNTDAADEAAESGQVHLNLVENGEVKSSHKIVGKGGISVTHTLAEGEDGVNTITIEAPEGAKYDLAAKTENGETILSLAGTDNTEDKVAIVGDDAVTVTINEAGQVEISAHDTKYGFAKKEGSDLTFTVTPSEGDSYDVTLEANAYAKKSEGGDTKDTASIAGAKLYADAKVAEEIGKLDATKEAAAGKYINKIVQVNGVITEIGEADIPTDFGVTSVELLPGTANGSLKLKVNGTEGTDVAVTGLEEIEVKHAVAAGKVDKALTVKVGGADVVFDGSQAKTADVDSAIADAFGKIPPQTDYTVSMTVREDEASDDHTAFKHYSLWQCGNEVAHIDIPRDLVVEEGHVREVSEAGKPYADAVVGEKYIELKIKNQETPLYIPAKDLVEYITVEDTNTIDLTLTTDHVLTAEVKGGTITEIHLSTEVTDKLNKQWATTEQGTKADSALQSVEVGTGLKVTEKADNKQTISIDDDVIFVLNCNY